MIEFHSFAVVSTMNPSPGAQVDQPLELDASQQRALSLFEAGSNVAVLGRAGCGKSEVTRRMISMAIATHGREAVAVTALSGSAALIVSGQTLHSLFSMNTRPMGHDAWLRETLKRPEVCRRLNRLRVLFIDEVCTLSSSLFSRFGFVMRRVAPPHMQHLPFAGCQLVCTFALFCRLYFGVRPVLRVLLAASQFGVSTWPITDAVVTLSHWPDPWSCSSWLSASFAFVSLQVRATRSRSCQSK